MDVSTMTLPELAAHLDTMTDPRVDYSDDIAAVQARIAELGGGEPNGGDDPTDEAMTSPVETGISDVEPSQALLDSRYLPERGYDGHELSYADKFSALWRNRA